MAVPDWNGVFGVNCRLAILRVLGVPEPIYYVLERDPNDREARREVRKRYSELSIRQQRKKWRHFCEYVAHYAERSK